MRDRARAGGDAGISAARPTRPMHWRAASRTHHSGLGFWFRSWEEADDLGVVLGSVDVVQAIGCRHDVDQLGPLVEHLARTGIAFECEELVPQLAREHHRWRPPAGISAGN